MTARKPTQERRREISDAAIKILGERGLRECTAAQLALEVGITDGTIFRHFKDKHEIILAALDRLQELIVSAPRAGADPVERLRDFVASRLHAVAVEPRLHSLLFSDQLSHALGADGPRQVAALRDRGRAHVRSCLREAADAGLVRRDLDVDAAMLLITGIVMSFLFATKDGALHAPGPDMEERIWQT
ncbi:MAG TPA: TetR/AcrR family transcriptional regulator, partial [Vicinamibacterales bacterium]|nr:TetR/AcrR family transcriptional regulator [Vicinamibacterales bacterium]